jgi:hypothetical protein
MQARRDEGWTRTDAGKGDDDDDGGADASDDFNIIYSVVGKIVRRARPRWNARLKCRTSRKKSVRFSSHPYL